MEVSRCSGLECLYAILGVDKESSTAEIRTAYRKLAMRWHPDKCCSFKGDAREQAKLKFQSVQQAYSVLSDDNRRVLYDAGLLEEVENDPGLEDFVGELVSMMNCGSAPARKKSSGDVLKDGGIMQKSADNLQSNSKLHKNSDVQTNSDDLQTNSDDLQSNSDDLQPDFNDLQPNSDELEDLRNLYMKMFGGSMVDPDIRKSECSDSGTTQSNLGEPREDAKQDGGQFSAGAFFPDTSRTTPISEKPLDPSCPIPHANLYSAVDFLSDFLNDPTSHFGYESYCDEFFTENDEGSFDMEPESQAQLLSHNFESFDLDLERLSAGCGGISKSSFEFDVAHPSIGFQQFPESLFATEFSSRTSSSLTPEVFCIGKSGNDSDKINRGQGKSTKRRWKVCEGNASKSPSSWCDICCQEKLGPGKFCFCTRSGVAEGAS